MVPDPPPPAIPTARPLKPVWFLLAILGGLIAITAISRLTAPREIIPWRTDFNAARSESAATGRPLLLYLTADWCGPCQTLRRTTWSDVEVERALRNFVPVKVDVDRQQEIALRYSSDAVPRFVLLAPDGRELKAADGYLDPPAFLDWLKK